MPPPTPIELIRLRSTVAAFVAILRDTLPLIEAMAETSVPPELRGSDEPLVALLEDMRMALDVSREGSVAGLLHDLRVVLNEPDGGA